MTAFNSTELSKGEYALIVEFYASMRATDPYGAEHVHNASVKYVMEYKLEPPPYTIRGTIGWASLSPMGMARYGFVMDASGVVRNGALLILIGAVLLFLDFALPVGGWVCRLVGR